MKENMTMQMWIEHEIWMLENTHDKDITRGLSNGVRALLAICQCQQKYIDLLLSDITINNNTTLSTVNEEK